MQAYRVIAAALLSLIAASAQAQQPLVKISSGELLGQQRDGVRRFIGIPYAAQPIGALRWQPPQPAPPWTAPLDASAYGPACPQPDDRLFGFTPPKQDEACLHLNVWAPAAHDQALPVMVWLHGGAHRIGSASLPFYDGQKLAARGVVLVTLNYRLGYLGFFSHPALDAEGKAGNFGLMDQIAALKWVRDNIAAFGGDPARVTVFGESAGGADVLYLMSSPAGSKLFSAAIVESGGGWNKPPTRKAMQKLVLDDLETVGVDDHADASALRKLPAKKVVDAQAHGALGFGPFVDDTTTFEKPSTVFAAGRQLPVPLIIGNNDYEGSLLKYRDMGFMGALLTRLPVIAGWYESQAPAAADRQPLLFRDTVFAAPARWIAAHQSRLAPTWLYRFSYVASARRGKQPGAAHAGEIGYVFDTLDTVPKIGAATSDEDRQMARQVADCWVAFASTHEPRCALAWKPYEPAADNVLMIDAQPHEARHPEGRILDGVTEWFGPDSFLGRH
ncbi:MAG: carboxylesterase/lipase family protein [Hydrocarboniphaga sp.]|uniref:carboxylesterase/lipase family protein n=1 Tax=Hydrocarboniphaga sp. TaxID=2033016 RepID=UPI0026032ECA|nr:carboxylesterase family protein [Hydrocarboniphaga sp.]MDB5971063.1 carboxylesterase/lipase family protein [Hydrocarboniphaga sp.]